MRLKERSVRIGVPQHIFIYLAPTREAKIRGGGGGQKYTFLERSLVSLLGIQKFQNQSHMRYMRKAFVAEA